MPLYANGAQLVRWNLEEIGKGNRVRVVAIGELTAVQLLAFNAVRAVLNLPPISAEILFLGRHVYKSRVTGDGYTIDDVIDQITSALDVSAEVHASAKMNAVQNPQHRKDKYGNAVLDRGVLECTARHPRPELFSVIPLGDTIKPGNKRGHDVVASEIVEDSTG
jgi:hypothetical protein